MKYAKIIKNDCVNGIGICVSLFLQGCPIHCKGCFNQETWDFNGGKDIDRIELLDILMKDITANGILRGLSILGGEPLAEQNIKNTLYLILGIRLHFPDIPIFLWTGYDINPNEKQESKFLDGILEYIDYIITGPYIEEERDLTLWLRGSRNQSVYHNTKLTNNKKYVKIDMINEEIQEVENE